MFRGPLLLAQESGRARPHSAGPIAPAPLAELSIGSWKPRAAASPDPRLPHAAVIIRRLVIALAEPPAKHWHLPTTTTPSAPATHHRSDFLHPLSWGCPCPAQSLHNNHRDPVDGACTRAGSVSIAEKGANTSHIRRLPGHVFGCCAAKHTATPTEPRRSRSIFHRLPVRLPLVAASRRFQQRICVAAEHPPAGTVRIPFRLGGHVDPSSPAVLSESLRTGHHDQLHLPTILPGAGRHWPRRQHAHPHIFTTSTHSRASLTV